MAPLTPMFKLTKANGIFSVHNPDLLAKYKQHLKDGDYFLSIGPPKKLTRSQRQNSWYWVAIVNPYAEHLGYEPEELHAVWGNKYLLRTVEFKGETITYIKSTTKLDTEEMSTYLQCCIQDCAEDNFIVPDPEEITL